jgi:hypothetical protein
VRGNTPGSVGLGYGCLAADLDLVDAVIADDAAPERVVEIEHEHLAALAVHGTHDRGERASDGDVGFGGGEDLVTEVAVPIEPLLQADDAGETVDVVDEKTGIGCGSAGELCVEREQKARGTAAQDGVEIAEDGDRRKLEVVLDDLGGGVLLDGLPDALVACGFGVDVALEVSLGALDRRHLHVEVRGVQEDDVGGESDEVGGVDDRVFVETTVFGLMECGLEAGVEQEDFE